MTLLDTILNDLQWSDEGIICRDYAEKKLVHKFMREAVLDRYIYNARIAGVCVSTADSKTSVAKTYISKHNSIGESYAELTSQLSDKVFFLTSNQVLTVSLNKGANKIEDVSFIRGGSPVSRLYVNDNVCRALHDNVVLSVFVTYDYGYKSMADNSKAIKSQHSSKYFPCNTDYSLAQYVRVLPPTQDSVVHMRFYNGMNPEYFKLILENWKKVIELGKMPEEVQKWLKTYE